MTLLFTPITIGKHVLKNRIFALPIFTGYARPDGSVSPLQIEYYHRVSRSSPAVVTVANVAVCMDGRTSENSLHLSEDKYIKELEKLASTIHKNGSLACIQLNHGGRYSLGNSTRSMLPSAFSASEITTNTLLLKDFMNSFPFKDRFSLTANAMSIFSNWFNEMRDEDFEFIIECFTSAAKRACAAGFDFIELHGATGYFITQFLSPLTNRRRDKWGGSLENRMRLPLLLFEKVQKSVSPSCQVGFRLLLEEKVFGGIEIFDAIHFAKELEKRGVAYLSVTTGTYTSMFMKSVVQELRRPNYLYEQTKLLQEAVSCPIIISGRILTPKMANKFLEEGVADMIGIGRPLLADSKWINKAKTGEKVIACSACGFCFRSLVLGTCVICKKWTEEVRHRIHLEWSFSCRHGYNTLAIYSDIGDFQNSKEIIQKSIPKDKNIYRRQIFINKNKSIEFEEKAKEHIEWSERYFQKESHEEQLESIYIADVDDPVQVVLDHISDNFGILTMYALPDEAWKHELLNKLPPNVMAFRRNIGANQQKMIIPCDLSVITLMQVRVAMHLLTKPNMSADFVHVGSSPQKAKKRWNSLLTRINLENKFPLHVIAPKQNIVDTLTEYIIQGDYGIVLLGKRSNFSALRKYFLGSISHELEQRFTDRSVGIIG